MSHFCLLARPDDYIASDWSGENTTTFWSQRPDELHKEFDSMLEHATKQYGRSMAEQVETAREKFAQAISAFGDDPPDGGGILRLEKIPGEILRDSGIADPLGYFKNQETISAASAYPHVVHMIHGMVGEERWRHLLRAVVAAEASQLNSPLSPEDGQVSEGSDFVDTVEDLHTRNWVADDFEAISGRIPDQPPAEWSKVVVFADKAGGQFVLGVMPLVRELAMWGVKIVLAADESSCRGTITADEAVEVIEQLAGADADLAAMVAGGMLEVVSTGGHMPPLDLSDVSDELNEAAADAELVILTGQHRAVLTNFNTPFTTDAMRLAMLQHHSISSLLNAEPGHCLCKYTAA